MPARRSLPALALPMQATARPWPPSLGSATGAARGAGSDPDEEADALAQAALPGSESLRSGTSGFRTTQFWLLLGGDRRKRPGGEGHSR